MHIPKYFREEDREDVLAFLKANSFSALVTFDGEKPIATHTPVEVAEAPDGQLTIFSHMSRANPQWKTFGNSEALFIFQGAHTYVSPRWYNHVNVPTWNYQIVHVYGMLRPIEGEELYALLSRLVNRYEAGTSYSVEGLSQDYVAKEMTGVFGFAMDVSRVDAGYKLSQNRNDEDHANIIKELGQRQDENSKQVASAMSTQREKTVRDKG